MQPILQVKDLKVQFHTLEGIVYAVNGITYDLATGQTLGIVGESACGKSVSVLSIMQLIPQPPGKIASGEILYQGQDLLKIDKLQMQNIRGKEIAMIFQDPMTSLNPVLTIGHQISEASIIHFGISREDAADRTVNLLQMVGIPQAVDRYDDFPHQFSGGMRQRVMFAMALSCNPNILIADEPTTALDVTIQAQIIDLTKSLLEDLNMSVIWITHDLAVIAELVDRVLVMYAGFVVEEADIFEIFEDPRHPYTLSLLKSLPRVDERTGERLSSIPGTPPDCLSLYRCCPFAPRCGFVVDRCTHENPMLKNVSSNHKIACWVDVTTGRER